MSEKAIRRQLEARIKELRSEASQPERVAHKLGSGSGQPSRARTEASAPKAGAKRPKARRGATLTTEMLVGAFNDDSRALRATELRQRLSLPKSVSDSVLRKQLAGRSRPAD